MHGRVDHGGGTRAAGLALLALLAAGGWPRPAAARATAARGGTARAAAMAAGRRLTRTGLPRAARSDTFSLRQVLGFPFPSEIASSPTGSRIAWILYERGVRNVYVAEGPDFAPRRVTDYVADDGRELTGLTFTRDGATILYVRGGDHGGNWSEPVPPNPDASTGRPEVAIWAVPFAGGKPRKVAEGDDPSPSPTSDTLAFLKDGAVWAVALRDSASPAALFYDRGRDRDLRWSPDGRRLAFQSGRGDHAFIGLYRMGSDSVRFLDPSTGLDGSPRWSPDGTRIVFVRRHGSGGPPDPILEETPTPWSIRVADAATGRGRQVWASPGTPRGSYPGTAGQANLHWMAGGRLAFLADLDGWPHLYSVPADGGAEPTLLTPGRFMVEYVAASPDGRFLVYNADAGGTPGDVDRRHLFRVSPAGGKPRALTSGADLSYYPVVTGDGSGVAFVSAGPRRPPLAAVVPASGGPTKLLGRDRISSDFPTADLAVPKDVTFRAEDGVLVHGQLFDRGGNGGRKPAVIFVHGGPPRQMLLGWHYFLYYSNSYAVNQYLADHGYVVLSVNYRLGIGYGRAFHHPADAGWRGASEYRDVLAGAGYLRSLPDVDSARIGIWGGSYGGYLTALALARNSDVFATGVDMHGVHDWTYTLRSWLDLPDRELRYEKGDLERALHVAWRSSPVAWMDRWTSPVLLVQGDDDRNVHFHQTVDLVQRLRDRGVRFEELVIPDEIHDFLRYASWLEADRATASWFDRVLRGRSDAR
ncbi:MAG: prolyl oligopeptidase family serine peptidase [Candidatus Palauibacterales bacterium]|nr:prolyl oligopeptidase family serine peptidase [Candidatus Palauibacterales bacterium]MDP2529466.1 prolyl oligopeptidase family serine peptidase [Candidatus Palauibacterales bacterium]MDP2585186.1 prolyl oligopeptidase family serine peptidase [Candidatus Palauibacterales bacterium]